MKKIFSLTLGLALAVSLISCGGSGDNNTNEAQSAAISAAVGPVIGGAIQEAAEFSPGSDSVNVNESGTVTIPESVCGDTGTMTGTITYDVDSEAHSGSITVSQTLTNCDGTDAYCAFPYVINGTLNTSATGSLTSINMAINANLSVTGFSTSALSCVIDLSVNNVNLETSTPEEIYEAIEGTICGKTPAEIATLIEQAESDPTEYCTALVNLPEAE
jgi:hypothetical protein